MANLAGVRGVRVDTKCGNSVDSRAETLFTTDMTQTPKILTQQAHAEFTTDGVLVLFANGEVRLAETAAKALAMVQRRDQVWAKGRVEPIMLVTSLTWHNCPDGFEPPEVS